MVTAADNQANIKRHGKIMVKWQGPYEVMGLLDGAPNKIRVRLVGTERIASVSWRRTRRIASSHLSITQAIQDAALHDLQKFKVREFVDWGFADDGTVVLKVSWQGFDTSEDTWEPLEQLYADVKVMVDKYVAAVNNDDLTAALDSVRVRMRARTAASRRQQDERVNRTYANAAAAAATGANAASAIFGQNAMNAPNAAASTTAANARNGRTGRNARNDQNERRRRNAEAASNAAAAREAADAARSRRAARRANRRR